MTRLSLVVAVRDAAATLQASLPAWEAAPAIDEIVVVDVASAVPLARLGLLARPKIVLVEAGRDAQGGIEPWARGLALNLGIEAASGDAVLVLDPGQGLADVAATLGRLCDGPAAAPSGLLSGVSAGPATPGVVPETVPALFARDAFLALGGFHEFLLGTGFEDQDLFNRFENAGERRRFLRPAERAAPVEPPPDASARGPLGGARANAAGGDGIGVDLPAELRASPFFQGERNRLLAGLVPWSPALAAMRPRRLGRRGPRHFASLLAPRTPLERRTLDVASWLAARILFQIPEDTVIPMLAGMIDDRSHADAARATRQHQVELAASLARSAGRR